MATAFDDTKVSSSASSSFISGQESPQQTTGRGGRPLSPGFSLNNVNPNAKFQKGSKHVDPNQKAPNSKGGASSLAESLLPNLFCELCRNVVEDPVSQYINNESALVCRKCSGRNKRAPVTELPIGVVAAIREILEQSGVHSEGNFAKEDISRNEENENPAGRRRVAGVARHAGRVPMDGSVASPSARDFDDDTSSVLIAERNDRSSIISDEAEARAKIMKFFSKKAAARSGPTSRDLKVEADKSYESANYTAALELYTKAIALQKEDGASQTKFLYGNRSAAYFMAGRFKECMEDCLVVFQMEPSNYKLLLRAALSAISMGDIERAVSILEIVPPKERESQEQLSVRYAEYKSALELYNKAESAFGTSEGDEMYRMLVAQFPTIVPFRERFAESLFRRKQYLRAVETLEVVSAKARPPKLLHLMANCLYLSGFEHFERARKCLEEVSQFDDDCRKLLNEINRVDDAKQKGNNNFSSKRFKESVEHYTAAINMAPNNLSILRILYCNRAAAYKEIGSYREGVEDCTRAIEIAPDFFKAYARRARCHINLGDNFAAVRDFKKALSLEKGDRELEKELRHAEAALSKEGEKEKDFYYQLGLTKTCSERDIKVKYRELSLRWHPDKCVGLDTLEKERAEHKFKIISEAYATLSDPAKRREYDWKQDRERLSRPAGFGFSGGFGAASGDQYRGNRYRARGGDTW